MSIINTVIEISKGNIDMDAVILEYEKDIRGIRVTVKKTYPYKGNGQVYRASTVLSEELGETKAADEAVEHSILYLTDKVRSEILNSE